MSLPNIRIGKIRYVLPDILFVFNSEIVRKILIRQHRSYQDADEVNSEDNSPWNRNELVDSELVERDTQRASTIPMYP